MKYWGLGRRAQVSTPNRRSVHVHEKKARGTIWQYDNICRKYSFVVCLEMVHFRLWRVYLVSSSWFLSNKVDWSKYLNILKHLVCSRWKPFGWRQSHKMLWLILAFCWLPQASFLCSLGWGAFPKMRETVHIKVLEVPVRQPFMGRSPGECHMIALGSVCLMVSWHTDTGDNTNYPSPTFWLSSEVGILTTFAIPVEIMCCRLLEMTSFLY